MGNYKKPLPVKLIIGLLGNSKQSLLKARKELTIYYGKEDILMSPIPFNWTHYYEKELGKKVLRQFVSYENLIYREEMVEIKRKTNSLEKKISKNKLRIVNIDPGYLTLGQFFLMTTKDQRHRIYLKKGIFAEVTLFFKMENSMIFIGHIMITKVIFIKNIF